jgi:isatin hydrolase
VIPGRRIVDLSLPLAEELPSTWPGDMPFQHKVHNWFTEVRDPVAPLVSHAAYHTRWVLISEHTGTHFDAPAHFVPPPDSGMPDASPAGAISSDRVPLEQLAGPAVVVDATQVEEGAPGHSPPIEPAVIERFEDEHGRIDAGEVVLLRTGWDRHYVEGPDGSRFMTDPLGGVAPAWPSPAPETIALLLERGVTCLGTDAPSVGAAHDPYPGHIAGLPHGLVYVECLTNLARLPVRGATFLFLPLAIRRGSGAPGRAIALLDD